MSQQFTTSQTIGPFFHDGLRWAVDLSKQAEPGARAVTISGVIYDGEGQPIVDALLESWTPATAGAESKAAIPAFRRAPTNEQGEFTLRLSLPETGGPGRPAAYLTVFARGLLKHQFTAVFLEDDAGLADSALLKQIDPERRTTLLARRQDKNVYRWDVRLQGSGETVFFDYR